MRSIIAILRGIQPHEAIEFAHLLIDAGIEQIEVPLNSPSPFDSIKNMIEAVGRQAKIGAGTVLEVDEVKRLSDLGADLVVSPNCDIEVIKATKAANMASYPGVMTPTEGFAALKAGADGLKFFPASVIGQSGLKAMKAVLPPDTQLFAVGGAGPDNFAAWIEAGATGFGMASSLYKAGQSAAVLSTKAREIVAAYDAATKA